MSAIWGAVSFTGEKISQEAIDGLKKPFEQCVIDRTEEIFDDTCYMGCGIQYFTEEAQYEKLPITNKDKTTFFNADVVIDNRKDLFNELQLSENTSAIPDGELQYRMFEKYGVESLNKMYGAFAMAHYDRNSGTVVLALDSVANRCLYYMVQDNVVYYSTLITSLINVKKPCKINDKWVLDFFSMDNLGIFTELEETTIEGIFHIAAAQVVTITKDHVKKDTYWNPEKEIKKINYKSDDEYKKQFQSIYKRAVRSVMRTKSPIAIMLSGGYDSTSVACLAARMLKKQGRKLYSYTSIPLKEYVSEYGKEKIVDESDDVKKTAAYLGNLECRFIDLKGVNPWDDRKKRMDMMEFPYKSVENVSWMFAVAEEAHKNGSRIMLSGAYGNLTVSFTNPSLYLSMLLRKGHFIRYIRDVKYYSSQYGFSRKKETAHLIKGLFIKEKREEFSFSNSYVNREWAKKAGSCERIDKIMNSAVETSRNYELNRGNRYHKLVLRQIGDAETKMSLMTGVLMRDPTKDRRMIEFCMSIPLEQYIRGNQERRLIACYMSELMPKHIFEPGRKGLQSADQRYRILKNWDSIRNEWISEYKRFKDSDYVECKDALNDLEKLSSGEKLEAFSMMRHMYTVMCLEYINKIQEITK